MVHKRNKVPRLVIEFYTKHMYKFEKKIIDEIFIFTQSTLLMACLHGATIVWL